MGRKTTEEKFSVICSFILQNKRIRVLTKFNNFLGYRSKVETQCIDCGKIDFKNWNKLSSQTTREKCKCKSRSGFSGVNSHLGVSVEWFKLQKELILQNMHIVVLTKDDEYVGQKQKLLCVCDICGEKFEKNINVLLQGYGCKLCKKQNNGNRLTEPEFNKIKQEFLSKKNAEILIEYIEYKSSKEKVKCFCHTCKNFFETLITYIVQGQGCSICNKNRLKLNPPKKLKTEQIKKDIEKIEKNLNLRLLLTPEEFKTVDDYVFWECLGCGGGGKTKYYQLKQNKGCRKCGIDKRTKNMIMSKEKFAQNVSKIEKFSSCKLLSTYEDYSSVNSLLNWRCDICGLVWASTFAKRMYRKTKCPNCCYDETEQEKLVGKYIECLGVQFTKHSRSALRPDKKQYKTLELDIWCNNQNFGVELNGTYWHSSTKKKNYKDYHKTKYNLAVEAGIDLIQIFEDEYTSNPDLIHSIIRAKVDKPMHTYDAASCTPGSITEENLKAFMTANSFETYDEYDARVELADGSNPLAVLLWRKDEDAIRFKYVVARDTKVAGGLQRLLGTITPFYPNCALETASDARYSLHDKELEACGFIWSHITEPDRFYCVDNYKTRIPAVGENVDNLPEIYGVGHNIYKKA